MSIVSSIEDMNDSLSPVSDVEIEEEQGNDQYEKDSFLAESEEEDMDYERRRKKKKKKRNKEKRAKIADSLDEDDLQLIKDNTG